MRSEGFGKFEKIYLIGTGSRELPACKSKINKFTIIVNHCGLSYGAWPVCFSVNAALETESNLYQLSYLYLPIHTSANSAQAEGRVDLAGYKFVPSSVCKHFNLFSFYSTQNKWNINSDSLWNRLQLSHQRLVFHHWVCYFHNFTVVRLNEKPTFCFNYGILGCDTEEWSTAFLLDFQPARSVWIRLPLGLMVTCLFTVLDVFGTLEGEALIWKDYGGCLIESVPIMTRNNNTDKVHCTPRACGHSHVQCIDQHFTAKV
jgi:hypothetical protein